MLFLNSSWCFNPDCQGTNALTWGSSHPAHGPGPHFSPLRAISPCISDTIGCWSPTPHGGAYIAAQSWPVPIPRDVHDAQGWGCPSTRGWGGGTSLGWQALPCCPAGFPAAPCTPSPGIHQPLLSPGTDSSILSSCCLAPPYRSGC